MWHAKRKEERDLLVIRSLFLSLCSTYPVAIVVDRTKNTFFPDRWIDECLHSLKWCWSTYLTIRSLNFISRLSISTELCWWEESQFNSLDTNEKNLFFVSSWDIEATHCLEKNSSLIQFGLLKKDINFHEELLRVYCSGPFLNWLVCRFEVFDEKRNIFMIQTCKRHRRIERHPLSIAWLLHMRRWNACLVLYEFFISFAGRSRC